MTTKLSLKGENAELQGALEPYIHKVLEIEPANTTELVFLAKRLIEKEVATLQNRGILRKVQPNRWDYAKYIGYASFD
jgi:hypothetical protein